MSGELDMQFAQATFNLLRHVVMSAPIPVIQALKDQLEAKYEQLVEPLHPGVDFLVRSCLEGEFEVILPMVEGLLQTGSAPNLEMLEQSLASLPPSTKSSHPAPSGAPNAFRPPGRGGYRDFFRNQ